MDNHVRLLMISNHDWVVPAGKDERRFATLDVGNLCAQNHEYFAELMEEIENGDRERLLHDLLAFDLSTVNPRQIPKTLALLEQKIHSLEPIDAWLFDRLQAGTTTRGHSDWPAFVPTRKLIDDYIAASDRTGVHRKATETQVRHSVPQTFTRREACASQRLQRRWHRDGTALRLRLAAARRLPRVLRGGDRAACCLAEDQRMTGAMSGLPDLFSS